MNTYTPKIGSMGEPWMMRDPNGGWVSLADHEEALRQANADPNDIEINTPLSEKVDRYKLVPVAEWERITASNEDHATKIALRDAELNGLLTSLSNAQELIKDHCDDEEKVRAILKEFDRSDSYGSDGSIVLAERAAAALKQARADRDVLAKAVRPVRDIQRDYGVGMLNQMFDWPTDELNATDTSGALNRAGGGE